MHFAMWQIQQIGIEWYMIRCYGGTMGKDGKTMTWEEINAIKAKAKEDRTPYENRIANLVPIEKQIEGKTREEKIEFSRKGGTISGKKKHERKLLREIASDLMSADFTAVAENDEKLSQMLQLLGNKAPTGGDLMMLSAMIKGIRGDVEALKFVRDTSGQRPADIQAVTVSRGDLDGVDLRTVSTEELMQIAAESDDDVTTT